MQYYAYFTYRTSHLDEKFTWINSLTLDYLISPRIGYKIIPGHCWLTEHSTGMWVMYKSHTVSPPSSELHPHRTNSCARCWNTYLNSLRKIKKKYLHVSSQRVCDIPHLNPMGFTVGIYTSGGKLVHLILLKSKNKGLFCCSFINLIWITKVPWRELPCKREITWVQRKWD